MRFKGKRPFSKSTLQHMHRAVYEDAVSEDFFDWAFTVVRNPFDRFASEYKMKVLDAGGSDRVEDWAEACFERFGEFKFTRDNHIRPQVEFISDYLEVYRFESGLEAPLRDAVSRLGLVLDKIPHAKRGSYGRLQVSERAIELIADFYSKDFELLGYDREDFSTSFEVS